MASFIIVLTSESFCTPSTGFLRFALKGVTPGFQIPGNDEPFPDTSVPMQKPLSAVLTSEARWRRCVDAVRTNLEACHTGGLLL